MGANTLRNRDPTTLAIAQLDLTSADAADRRFEIDPDVVGARGLRFFGFSYAFSSLLARDITVSRVDRNNADKVYPVEARLGDTGADGEWVVPGERISGTDTQRPSTDEGMVWRIQFGQTVGACLVDVVGDYKEI